MSRPVTPLGAVNPLEQPVEKLLGKRTAQALAAQGVATGGDLIRLLPRRYDTWGEPTILATLTPGEHVTVQAQVCRAAARRTRSGRPPAILEASVTDGTSMMDVVLFGAAGLMKHYADQLTPGTTVMLAGKVGERYGRLQLASPRLEILEDLDESERAELIARPVPIYPATDALPSWRVATAVRTVLDQLTEQDLPDPLPESVRAEHDLLGALEAYQKVHRPATDEEWRQARRRLRFEEAFVLQAALAGRRALARATQAAVAWPVPGEGSLRAQLDATLPYTLTASQEAVGHALEQALASTTPMQTLLQGDVGSGKTLVALRAMCQVVGAGGQAALLAPTEVLAAQHSATLTNLLGPLGQAQMLGAAEGATSVHLLTGSTPAARRRELLTRLAGGEPGIIVGTHALLSPEVQLPFLGLIVVDEQHRFGVAQRDALREQPTRNPATGESAFPHLLVMTATPIPRTIAMTIFGDLETVTLQELPAGRRPVATTLVPWERQAWVDRIWERAAQEVAAGGRVYVVCPRIGATDLATTGDAPAPATPGEEGLFSPFPGSSGMMADAATPHDPAGDGGVGLAGAASVEAWEEILRATPTLAGIGIGVLTGRMAPAEKDAAMAAFASGNTPILLATTVIEVGVDVPEASMMVILDAERFGLSQLHQLRGRVGRGQREALCVAVTGAEVGSAAFHRLKAFAGTTDGFALAEEDLRLRREGNILGAAQSGSRSDLDLLSVSKHVQVIEQARADAWALVESDPHLESHPELAAAISRRVDAVAQQYMERA